MTDATTSCVLCLGPLDGSLEHILLSALGGRKTSRKVICGACNNATGSSIDDALAAHLAVAANQFDIQTGRGEVGPTLRNVSTTKGERLDLLPGGKPSFPKALVVETPLPDGTTQIQIRVQASDAHKLAQLKEGMLKKYKVAPEHVRAEQISFERTFLDEAVELRFQFGGPEDFRALAKMALLLFADAVGGDHVLPRGFDEIRAFIRVGEGYEKNLVNHETRQLFPDSAAVGSRQVPCHRLLVSASKRTHAVVAVIELFGIFTVSLLLTRDWTGDDHSVGYRIDPTNGKQADLVQFPPSEFGADAVLEHAPVATEFMKDRIGEMGEHVEQRQQRELIHSISEQVLEEYLARKTPTALPTSEDFEWLKKRAFEELSAVLGKQRSSRPLSPDELTQLVAKTAPTQQGRRKKRRKKK